MVYYFLLPGTESVDAKTKYALLPWTTRFNLMCARLLMSLSEWGIRGHTDHDMKRAGFDQKGRESQVECSDWQSLLTRLPQK